MYIMMHIQIYIHVYTCIHMYIYLYYTYIYIYTYIYMYIVRWNVHKYLLSRFNFVTLLCIICAYIYMHVNEYTHNTL